MDVLVSVGIEREISVHPKWVLCERDASKRGSTWGGMNASGWSANGTQFPPTLPIKNSKRFVTAYFPIGDALFSENTLLQVAVQP